MNASEPAVEDATAILDVWLAHQTSLRSLPGLTAAVAVGDRLAWSEGYGTSSRGQLSARTPLFAGSVTKVFTAAMTLRLVEDGVLSLDDPVHKHVPGFRARLARTTSGPASTITVRQLLRHSSGLPREVPGHPYWVTYDFPTGRELVAALNNAPLLFKPGTDVSYSNAAFGVLGLVIERLAGMPAEDAIEKRILKPLGLTSTVMRPTDAQRRQAPQSYTAQKRFLGGGRIARPIGDARAMGPAFGALTTTEDLARFFMFLTSTAPRTRSHTRSHTRSRGGGEGEDVLSLKSRAALFYGFENKHTPGRGLGMKREAHGTRVFMSHTGWFSGFRTHVALDPARRVVVVIQATTDGAAVRPLAFSCLDYLLNVGIGAERDPRHRVRSRPTGLEGTYGVQWLPDFDLVAQGAGLALFVPPDPVDSNLAKAITKVEIDGRPPHEHLQLHQGGPWSGAVLDVKRAASGEVTSLLSRGSQFRFDRRAKRKPDVGGGIGVDSGGSGGAPVQKR